MAHLKHVTPDDEYFWCPADTEKWGHFHAIALRYADQPVCEACGVEISVDNFMQRYKARVPWRYVISEEDELDLDLA